MECKNCDDLFCLRRTQSGGCDEVEEEPRKIEADSEYEATRKIIVERMKKWRCEATANCCSADIMAANRALDWLENRRSAKRPKWLYRLEYRDSSCGLWYDGGGRWCFDSGIGSLDDSCKTKTLPMDYDERYKQDGRDWFSSCSRKEDLLHWYSKEDARKLLDKGFVFTRYLATEYHEYDQQTVFIKETALFREEIDFFSLMGEHQPAEWSEEDETMWSNLIGFLEGKVGMLPSGKERYIKWLKERFVKLVYPKPGWKPSEEQMKALCSKLPIVKGGGDKIQDILETLYDDLKKLM